MAKLDGEKVAQILSLHIQNKTITEISQLVGVSPYTVSSYIRKNKHKLQRAEEERQRKLDAIARKRAEADFSNIQAVRRISPALFRRIEELIPVEEDLNKLKGIAQLFHEIEQSEKEGVVRQNSSELLSKLRGFTLKN